MNRFYFFAFVFLGLISVPKLSFGQDTSRTVTRTNYKQEIVINHQRFRIWNNWTSGGFGLAYHSKNPRTQVVLNFNYNFHIHQYYFRFGGLISGDLQDGFSVRNNYQAHIGYVPYRVDNQIYHAALIGGISYSTGYRYLYGGNYDNINPYKAWGVYLEAQYIRKISYGVGGGLAFFVNVDSANTLAGICLDVYLSSAYKGYAKGYNPPPK